MKEQEARELEQRYQKLESKKTLLMRLDKTIAWSEFRPLLEKIHDKPRKSNAGRKPIDVIVMFKMLVLQQLYNISDEELEYQVNDRLSFMRFLGLTLWDSIPDATTVWLFKHQLEKQGLIEELFEKFEYYLRDQGYQAKGGQIVDATMIPVPKQHNSKEEKQQLEQGQIPVSWQEKPHRLSQKDRDARWTKKNGRSYFGYKNHINIDVDYGFIRRYEVTDAAVHDSQVLGALLDNENQGEGLWGDSAYRSSLIESVLEILKFLSHINERAYRNRPLTEKQIESNRQRSKVRAKVEHVFGHWVNSMGGKLMRSIGQQSVKATIGLKNLVYNLKRYVFWKGRKEELVG
ncbi:MAG: IS5 family transposase [Cyanobacteria bacterium P01_C01_bin.72]